jgi:flagellar hook-associated protein 2
LGNLNTALTTQSGALDVANAALSPLEAALTSKQAALSEANGNKDSLWNALTSWEVAVAQNPADAPTVASRDAALTAYNNAVTAQSTAETNYNTYLTDPTLLANRADQQKALVGYNDALGAKNNQDLVVATATDQLVLAQTAPTANTTSLSAANLALEPAESSLAEKLAALDAANTAKTAFEAARQERQIALTAAQNPAAAQAAYDTALVAFDAASADQLLQQTAYDQALADIGVVRTTQSRASAEYQVALSDKNALTNVKAQAQADYDAAAADQITKDAAAVAALAAIPDRTATNDAVTLARADYDTALADVRTKQDLVGVAQDAYDTAAAESTDLTLARQAQTTAKSEFALATTDVQTKTAAAVAAQSALDSAQSDRVAKDAAQIAAQAAFDAADGALPALQADADATQSDYDALVTGPLAAALQAKTDAQALYDAALAIQVAAAQVQQAALTARDAGQVAVDNANAAINNRPGFTPSASGADIAIAVSATDTVATLAEKINSANIGVIAVVFKDGVNDRLQLTSKATGVNSGFRVQVSDSGDGNDTDNAGLSRFGFDPQSLSYGFAASGAPPQFGQDARARINGIAVTSATNTLADNFPGVTINLLATTTTGLGTLSEKKTPITMSVREDVTQAVKNVQDFVTAFNALISNLADVTKYDAATKTPSIFQGDATIVGLQSLMRNLAGSISNGSAYKRLSDIGLQRQLDGTLSLNTTKLSAAANNGTELLKFFTLDNKNAQTNGMALKFSVFAKGAVAAGGVVVNKDEALKKGLQRNSAEQKRISDRADATEARLRRQYSALDAKMASLSALNAYVAQQVTTWNKSTG